ncbi:MAG TPA: bifunctional 4-hydroxy-2-oxoglutarate aldolase/2-dehydro-3-deoxy-phosphogluconate aldolase [Rubrobacteraceae bacterium]|nr:bifunctional 4-hydroxy-2-oxoglutarate aldolase/2-dehydro-3-deoxy-phosphogluconate aldolase [Rubrobacteraceae bacterium]
MDKQAILTRIAELGLLAVMRAPDPAGARRAVDALVEAGVVGIEITYSTPDAASVIAAVKQSYGDEVLVGAGTLVTHAQVAEAAEAGASYLVSPGLDDEVVASMRGTSLPAMAGILTPTEVMRGVRLGVDVMKLFPGSLGGPSYLRSLRGPFPDVPFMPTGGVSADNVGDWLAAGAIAVGAGGELASAGDISAGDFAGIREKGRRFVAAIREARADAAPRASR